MTPLADLLRAEIAHSGAMSFRDFMARALYDPVHGYYGSGRARIGRKGDYITSVSVGPLFGILLARQFIEMWEVLGRPEPFDLVEQGAFDGTLAADVIEAVRRLAPECPVRLLIVEPLKHWRCKQSERSFGCETRWFQDVEALPEFTGVHFSNELSDAFPVHLVHRTVDGWRERFVSAEDEGLALVNAPFSSSALAEYVDLHLQEMPVNTVTEVNLDARDWIRSLSGRVKQGYVLIIDYGWPRAEYYAPHRTTGTLEAIGDHRRESDPLSRPGELDLTAHVDFTSLAESAEAAGMRVTGFTDQHHFLVGPSRLHFVEGTRPAPRDARAFQTLSHPTMLGRAFKVLCLEKSAAGLGAAVPPLSGFSFSSDPRAALGLSG